jgi:hypothetical protein
MDDITEVNSGAATPIHGEGLYHPTGIPMDMHTIMVTTIITAMTLSSMPTPWI